MLQSILIFISYLMDRIIGDPYSFPHPVKLMGTFINKFSRALSYQKRSEKQQYFLGVLLFIVLLSLVYIFAKVLLLVSYKIHNVLGDLVSIYFMYSCFSIKSMGYEARKVLSEMKTNGLTAGRRRLTYIVGRDTEVLSEKEIYKAVIETVAENSVDGFISPLFFILLWGPVGGLLYKAVNTLDSMVGYSYLPYKYYGRFSARMDDLANFFPARLSLPIIVLSSASLSLNWKKSLEVGWRDRYNHKSPNSAWSESAFAGALEISLGGPHYYKGNYVYKPKIGESMYPVCKEHVEDAINILERSSILALIIGTYVRLLLICLV